MKFFGQGTGVMEYATIQSRTRQVDPKLKQVGHPLPSGRGVQPDVMVPNMYALPGQVCNGRQTPGHSNVGGQPLREDGNGISSTVVAIHPSPLQGSQHVGSVDGSAVPKHSEASDHFVCGLQNILYFPSTLGNILMTMRQYLLFLSLWLVQMPFEGLALACLLLFLSLLVVGRLMPCGDEDFIPLGSTLALGSYSASPVLPALWLESCPAC